MSSKDVRIELNSKGVQELLKGGKMQSILAKEAAKKANRAGAGYQSAVHVGQKRAYANIYPGTFEARLDNYENNTLEKVIRS